MVQSVVSPMEIQIDAGYDDDCCNQILQGYIAGFAPDDLDQGILDTLHNADCETLLDWIGSSYAEPFDPDHPDRTWRDVYNECANNKMPRGGDFMMGEPMSPIDLAFAVLKAALPEGVSLRFDPRWYDNEQMGEDVSKCPNCGTEDINDFFTPENQEQWEMDEYNYPEGHPLCYWCWKDWMKHSANQEQIGRWGR